MSNNQQNHLNFIPSQYITPQQLQNLSNEFGINKNAFNIIQKSSGDDFNTKQEDLSSSKQEDSSMQQQSTAQCNLQQMKPQKQPWTEEEDKLVFDLVQQYGAQKWTFIAQNIPGRIGKQCRERWHNHLNPVINKQPWSDEEEWILFLCHHLKGNKWAEITQILYGRTDNCKFFIIINLIKAIKNHWNSSMKKRIPELRAKISQLTNKEQIKQLKSIHSGRYEGIETELLEKLVDSGSQANEGGENMSNSKRKFLQNFNQDNFIQKRGRKPKNLQEAPINQLQQLDISDNNICYQTPEKVQKTNTGEGNKKISQFNILSTNLNSIKKIDQGMQQAQQSISQAQQPQTQSTIQQNNQFICESPSVFLITPNQNMKKVNGFSCKDNNYDMMMSPFMLFKQTEDKGVENSFKKLYEGVMN